MSPDSIERLISDVQSMDRHALTDALLKVRARFPLDFSSEFLAQCSVEKLKHVLMAAYIHADSHQQ